MTGNASMLRNYSPCSHNVSVRIADGTLSKVASIGSTVISKELTLDTVLLVLNLDCTLLFISKLTRDLNCITKISSTSCVFQDLDSERTIGNARMCAELYFLENEMKRTSSFSNLCASANNFKFVYFIC